MSKFLKAFFAVAGVAVIILSAVLIYSCAAGFDFTVGGKSNLKLLEELNASWTLDEKYAIETQDIGGMHAEWLCEKGESPREAILQLHGGAYIRGLNYRENLYQRMAEKYADISGMGVLTIDYRTAPENPFPAALDDAVAAYNYLLGKGYKGRDIIVAGDSAGGGLALALNLYLRDNGIEMPLCIITMSAWTDLDYRRTPAYVGDNNPQNPYISPVYGNFQGLPPMLMQVGTRDIIKDTERAAGKAAEGGTEVTQTTYKGMVHVFQALFPRIEEANAAWAEAAGFIDRQTNNI